VQKANCTVKVRPRGGWFWRWEKRTNRRSRQGRQRRYRCTGVWTLGCGVCVNHSGTPDFVAHTLRSLPGDPVPMLPRALSVGIGLSRRVRTVRRFRYRYLLATGARETL